MPIIVLLKNRIQFAIQGDSLDGMKSLLSSSQDPGTLYAIKEENGHPLKINIQDISLLEFWTREEYDEEKRKAEEKRAEMEKGKHQGMITKPSYVIPRKRN